MLGQEQEPEREHDDADGYVDQEDPVPREPRHQDAADDGRGRGRQHHDPGHHPRHVHALRGRVSAVEHRGADRDHHAAPGTLENSGSDQLDEVPRRRGETRRDGEQGHRGEKCALSAEPVSDPTRCGNEHGQTEEVADDDPLDRGDRHSEIPTDGRERDVDDLGVHDGHEHPRPVDDRDRSALGDQSRRRVDRHGRIGDRCWATGVGRSKLCQNTQPRAARSSRLDPTSRFPLALVCALLNPPTRSVLRVCGLGQWSVRLHRVRRDAGGRPDPERDRGPKER